MFAYSAFYLFIYFLFGYSFRKKTRLGALKKKVRMQLNLTSKLSCMIFVFFYCFYSSQNYNCISAYVLLHDASTLLSMVLMRF